MQINTKQRQFKLTKRECQLLIDANNLLGTLSEAANVVRNEALRGTARVAREAMGKVLVGITEKEVDLEAVG